MIPQLGNSLGMNVFPKKHTPPSLPRKIKPQTIYNFNSHLTQGTYSSQSIMWDFEISFKSVSKTNTTKLISHTTWCQNVDWVHASSNIRYRNYSNAIGSTFFSFLLDLFAQQVLAAFGLFTGSTNFKFLLDS